MVGNSHPNFVKLNQSIIIISAMSVAIPVFKAVSQIQLTPGSTINIPDISWEEFEAILQ